MMKLKPMQMKKVKPYINLSVNGTDVMIKISGLDECIETERKKETKQNVIKKIY